VKINKQKDMKMDNFKQQLEKFVKGCQELSNKDILGSEWENILTVVEGKRYAKIIRTNFFKGQKSQSSVHCFVDMNNGDIVRAASYKAPAKNGVRGNIFKENLGLDCMSQYGTKNLR
jgi:hypothetical protein